MSQERSGDVAAAPVQFPAVTLKPSANQTIEQFFATVPASRSPSSLADFGYVYNQQGALVQKSNGLPFVWMGQKHYDKLGDAIVEELYRMLEQKYAMSRLQVPFDAVNNEPTCPIFVSPGFEAKASVMYLCQGSGAVRPGMWARALCINESLQTGSIFRYVDEAYKRGWGVVVVNPNENVKLDDSVPEPAPEGPNGDTMQYWLGTADSDWKRFCHLRNQKLTPIRGSRSPMEHAHYVYHHLLMRQAPQVRNIFIVAHSFGGRCTTAIVRNETADVAARVRAIAFTDAINDLDRSDDALVKKIMQGRCINWVASHAPLDTPERGGRLGCRELSSGHVKHENTSESCRTSVFAYFDQVLEATATSSGNETKK